MFGLSEQTLASINACLQQHPEIVWAKIYGSRAKGNYERGSDIDLAFSSPSDISAELLAALDDLPTPYLFDVTHYESLKHAGLKEHIDRVGVVFYPSTSAVRPERVVRQAHHDREIPSVRPELVEGHESAEGTEHKEGE